MKKYFYEIIVGIGVLSILVLVGLFSFSRHEVSGYYLSGDSDVKGQLRIYLDIDWQEDKKILLDRDVSYEEAIELTVKLNKSLNHE